MCCFSLSLGKAEHATPSYTGVGRAVSLVAESIAAESHTHKEKEEHKTARSVKSASENGQGGIQDSHGFGVVKRIVFWIRGRNGSNVFFLHDGRALPGRSGQGVALYDDIAPSLPGEGGIADFPGRNRLAWRFVPTAYWISVERNSNAFRCQFKANCAGIGLEASGDYKKSEVGHRRGSYLAPGRSRFTLAWLLSGVLDLS